MKLTDLAIRKLPLPRRGQKIYFDEALPSFGIRCSQKSKSFVVIYGHQRHLKTLGRFPAKSLSEARREAMHYLGRNRPRSVSMSYVGALNAFLEDAEAKNRPNTVREYRRYLNRLDFEGDVEAITRQHLRAHIEAPHALMAFKVFFNWCVRNEFTDRNSLAGERPRYNAPKARVLTREELKAVWSYEEPPFSDIVRLLILMGQRRTETSLISADWIDGDLITFPAEVTKNRREHTIPYGELSGSLLPPRPFAGWSKAKAGMDRTVDIPPWTLHDLRRTFATMHAEIGTPIHVTERLLNHVSGTLSGVAAIYNRHTYLSEMRLAVANYEAHLQSLVGGKDAKDRPGDRSDGPSWADFDGPGRRNDRRS